MQVDKQDWNACALGQGELNPFLLWEFLHALEESNSAVRAHSHNLDHALMQGPLDARATSRHHLLAESRSGMQKAFHSNVELHTCRWL